MKQYGGGSFREVRVGYARIDLASKAIIPPNATIIGFVRDVSITGNTFEYVVYTEELPKK